MKIGLATLLLAAAVPVAAQMPPPGEMADAPHGRGNPMFAGMSDAGRATMHAALRGADPHGNRAATAAARDRMLATLDADRLDVGVLRRAMDDEREAANAAKARHQAGMIAGFQQLSAADRHAFVTNARALRGRVEGAMGHWRGGGGRDGDGPAMMPPH